MYKRQYLFTAPHLALGAAWAKVSGAYAALVIGAVGSPQALALTTAKAAPLICAGLGVGLGFRSGLFNIGCLLYTSRSTASSGRTAPASRR